MNNEVNQNEGSYNPVTPENNNTPNNGGNKNNKGNKTTYLIIGGIVVLVIILVIMLTSGSKDNSEDSGGFFDFFTNMFKEQQDIIDEGIEKQDQMMEDAQDTFDAAQKQIEVSTYNSQIDDQGLVSGFLVTNLLNNGMTAIADTTKSLTITFNGTVLTNATEILTIITEVDSTKDYTVINTKDADGFINTITITVVE